MFPTIGGVAGSRRGQPSRARALGKLDGGERGRGSTCLVGRRQAAEGESSESSQLWPGHASGSDGDHGCRNGVLRDGAKIEGILRQSLLAQRRGQTLDGFDGKSLLAQRSVETLEGFDGKVRWHS